MTNQSEQVIRKWTTLKQKLDPILHPNKWALIKPKSSPHTVREQDYVHQLSMQDFLNLRQVGKNKEYEEQLRIRLNEFTNLEKKLESIRGLILTNQLEKLKRMMRKGGV